MKLCNGCGLSKSTDAFAWKNRSADKRHSRCKDCVNAQLREAWADNDRYGKKALQLERLAINAEIVRKVKQDKPCMDCGLVFPMVCMDFDHRDPSIKEFNIASIRAGSAERLRTEIAKCDLVCANCHRIRTHGGEK